MAYFRRPKDHKHPYAQVSNDMLEDGRLSFKAKGLLSYLLSRSDEWQVYQSQLADLGPDGEHAVRSGLQELMQQGYMVRNRLQNDDGTFAGYEYVIYEAGDAPSDPNESDAGSSDMGKPDIGESQPTNTDVNQNGKNQNGEQRAREDEDPVAVYSDVFSNRPTNFQKEKMRATVDDLETWRQAVEWWASNSYKAQSVGRILMKYKETVNGEPLYRSYNGQDQADAVHKRVTDGRAHCR